jgi:hypothetical protein
MSESDKIQLAFLVRELAPLLDQRPPKNRKLWEMIVDGDIPAEQTGGRWFVKRADLPGIVEILRQVETARPVPKRIRTTSAAA